MFWYTFGWAFKFSSEPLPKGFLDQLVQADNFEACSLNPTLPQLWDPQQTNANNLLGFKILGRVPISDPGLRRKLLERIGHDIANSHHVAFNCTLAPHHGIQCTSGTNTFLMAICYTCGDVEITQNGKESWYLIQRNGFVLDPSSKRLFNQIFREAGIKTAD